MESNIINLVHQIWHYGVLHKDALLALVGGSAGLSVVLQVVLHKVKVDSKKVAFSLIHLFSIVTGLAAYVLSSVSPNAGITYVWLVGLAQVWHRFVVSPVYTKYALPFLDWLTTRKPTAAPVQPQPSQDTFLS